MKQEQRRARSNDIHILEFFTYIYNKKPWETASVRFRVKLERSLLLWATGAEASLRPPFPRLQKVPSLFFDDIVFADTNVCLQMTIERLYR